MKKYKCLTKKYRDQDSEEVFSHFLFNKENGENWETPLKKLAQKVVPENWNYVEDEFKNQDQNYPILINYLNNTFLKLQEENKIIVIKKPEGKRACFNTGLQTREGKDVFAVFFENINAEEKSQTDFNLFGFFDGYSNKVRDFEPLPEIATFYTDNTHDLVFNPTFDFEIQYDHIINDHPERLPESIRNNSTLARHSINGAVEQLKNRLARNYKLAIPHWFNNRIQLLLPLSITDDNATDLALVAERDEERKKYMVRTVLTLDMAYIDARTICAPDKHWLNP